MTGQETVPATGTAPSATRVAALDWARGWMLVASVGVNSAFLPFTALRHAPWTGVTPIDFIFPLFVTLAGCGTAFAFRRRIRFLGVLRRCMVLFLLGLVYNVLTTWNFDLGQLRIFGVLQLYAVVVMVMALLHLVTRSWRGWLAVTALFALAHSALISMSALACPADLVTPACNPSGPIDSLLVGASHTYQLGLAGHDPEGIIAIFGALISASAGASLGHLILDVRNRPRPTGRRLPAGTGEFVVVLVVFGVVAIAVAVLPDLLGGGPVPMMKRLWTAPFALPIAAIAAALLWLGLLLVPAGRSARTERRWTPIIALGRNSLLVYFGSHLAMSLVSRPIGDGASLLEVVTAPLGGGTVAQAIWTLVWLAGWIALAMVLHRHRIYLKP